MNELLIVGGLLAVLWAGLLFLKVPSSVAFLSLLIGQLISSEAGNDLYNFVAGVANITNEEYVRLGALLLPLIVTLLLMRGRVGSSKMSVEFIPYLCVAALAIVLSAPLLPALQNILEIASNDQLAMYKSIIVIAACTSGLISAWLSYPKTHAKVKAGKH